MNAGQELQAEVKFLCIEDEPNMQEDICGRMEEALQTHHSACDATEFRAGVSVTTTVHKTDNLAEARELVSNGECDIMLLDYKLKPTKVSTGPVVACFPLLRDIGRLNANICIIGHTAFLEDMLTAAKTMNLSIDAFSKLDTRSIELAVSKCVEATDMIAAYKLGLLEALAALRAAAEAPEAYHRQHAILEARRYLALLHVPENASLDYRRAISTLKPVLLRVSSVDSRSLNVRQLSPEFVKIVDELVAQLVRPTFAFSEHATPAFLQLEALGYEVFLRGRDDSGIE